MPESEKKEVTMSIEDLADARPKRTCDLCDGDGHPNQEWIVYVDGKPFCMNSRERLCDASGELEEMGEYELTNAEIDALLAEKIEPKRKTKSGLPVHPWNGKEWRIINPAPKPSKKIDLFDWSGIQP